MAALTRVVFRAAAVSDGSCLPLSRCAQPLRAVTSGLRASAGPSTVVPRRFINLQEADSLHLMKGMGVTTAKCEVATTPAEAEAACNAIGTRTCVKSPHNCLVGGEGWAVKAQVLAGGRGKGHFDNGFQGGVHLVHR